MRLSWLPLAALLALASPAASQVSQYTPPPAGAPAWGSITGTLTNQTDLNTALSGKVATSTYTTGLAAKVDTSTYTTGLAGKVDTSTYTTGIATIPTPVTYVTGRYYAPPNEASFSTGTAVASGTVYLVPGFFPRPVTISALVTRITTLATSGNCQFSLYAADATTQLPTGAPTFTSSSQSTGSTGTVEVAASKTLSGLVYVGTQCDNSTAIFVVPGPSNSSFGAFVGAVTSANIIGVTVTTTGFAKTGTFGVWPTLTGNATTDSLTEPGGSGKGPAWLFKAA